ncbi:unnamed protein product [Clonostachys rhizophaga]|uniref:non-specific serine/threonine protein kinase n=1 Tax=Clonostachys rhizophaga TaxID=160324 RepID=A0A9N9YJN3_9HYPO|nr:unnamed protein product [Clonostachys rhizophaga]
MSEEPEPLKPLRAPLPGDSQGYGWDDRYEEIVKIFPHEPLEKYLRNGFHPVTLGDRFYDGRYTVRHKLGFGGNATVWLVRDGRENQWVALKIKQAKASLGDIEQDPEVKAMKLLEHKYTIHGSTKPRCFSRLLHYFQHIGPNGTHTCLVTELLGPSIEQMIRVFDAMIPWDDPDYQEVETFRPDTILRSSRQLLEDVKTLRLWGIVHGGMEAHASFSFHISPSNVSFTCQDAVDDEELIEVLGGEPTVAEYSASEPRAKCLPKHLVRAATWCGWFDCPEESIRLIDWGESFLSNDKVSLLSQPLNLRSPETFFIGYFDHQHDLWRAGCVRRHFVVTLAEKAEDFEKPDFIEDDYQGLSCLLSVMEGLMQHEPHKRITSAEALARIQWVDQWVYNEPENEEE